MSSVPPPRRASARTQRSDLFARIDAVKDTLENGDPSAALGSVFEGLGCEGVTMITFHPMNPRSSLVPLHSSLSADLFEGYHREGLDRLDPVLSALSLSDRPFAWSELSYGAAGRVREYWSAFGFHDGVSVPFHAVGGRLAAVNAPSSTRLNLSERQKFELSLFCQLAYHHHLLAADEAPASDAAPPPPKLARREAEVLTHVMQNKTDAEIASILGVRTATVSFHMQRARARLGTHGRFATAMTAWRMGLLI